MREKIIILIGLTQREAQIVITMDQRKPQQTLRIARQQHALKLPKGNGHAHRNRPEAALDNGAPLMQRHQADAMIWVKMAKAMMGSKGQHKRKMRVRFCPSP